MQETHHISNHSEEVDTAEWEANWEEEVKMTTARRKSKSQRPPHQYFDTTSSADLWMNPELRRHEATVNLDNQKPSTLYYLGRVKDVPKVCEVYVEELEKGRRKHWTVISERDYEVMDLIYDIEEDTKQRFPLADISFRVTLATEDGPSVAPKSTKIFESY